MIHQTKAFHLAIMALFIAIVIIQNFVPLLGYIPIGPLSLTIIQITVIIAAVLLGPTDGAIIGGVWGFLSCLRAFTAPTSPVEPLIFTNPLISILPRILVGLAAGYLVIFFKKINLKQSLYLALIGLIGALINTVLILGLIYIFYRTPSVAHAYGVSSPKYIAALLVAVIGSNGIPEAVLSAIATPLITLPILRYWQRND